MGISLAVGRLTLDQVAEVRILHPQPATLSASGSLAVRARLCAVLHQLSLEPPPRRLPACFRLGALLWLLARVNPCELGQLFNDAHRLHADGADALQQVDDSLLVAGEFVVVEFIPDGGVPKLFLLVLVQHPLQSRAATQAVAPGGFRHPGQRRVFVQFNSVGRLVGR